MKEQNSHSIAPRHKSYKISQGTREQRKCLQLEEGEKKKMRRHKFGSTLHRLIQKGAHFATGTFIPNISVHQPFFPQDNTNHLKLSNMFTQSLSHMFPWPMCQKTEQLPIKVLLKSSECEPNCLTWCDTIATLSPHHCLILEVLEGV